MFEGRLGAGEIYPFVNFGGFAFHCPEDEDLVSLFWQQFDCIRPETYIGDCDYLTVVSADKIHFAKLLQRLGQVSDI